MENQDKDQRKRLFYYLNEVADRVRADRKNADQWSLTLTHLRNFMAHPPDPIISEAANLEFTQDEYQKLIEILWQKANDLRNDVPAKDIQTKLADWLFQGDWKRQFASYSYETQETVKVIEQNLPFDELPQEVQNQVNELRSYDIDDPIVITIIFAWILNTYWLLHQRDFEASISLLNWLLVILMYARDLMNKDN